ncbi:MAG: hypothetical protein UT24_C0024G0018 [Candidatus Woesebacteria bacterium GW2011_GWB1_39_12]|uniref:Uncharacterized protein n=1 Tax=Candidatus Woesebacteria bacterium GW2011_GWB1_39_12 TaxID=1618574 RepID=A0A0G0M575_9BACT|nr:MAG: hypothetical protein UT24_C0024G0018 [Candidatus Woesebacteria bacterium GW2011_GWB1_39_12]
MKIGTPEMPKKPLTKYKDHLYIGFKTVQKELFYNLTFFQTKSLQVRTQYLPVRDMEHFNQIMAIKANEVKA